MTRFFHAALGLIVLPLAGCGGGTTEVSGRVTFQGKPLVFGTVVMIGSDGIPKSGPIQPDGTYRVKGVKTGMAQLAISSPPPPGAASAGPKTRGGREENDDRTPADAGASVSPEVIHGWFPIPDKFADHTLSGQTAGVRPGQPVDIDLK